MLTKHNLPNARMIPDSDLDGIIMRMNVMAETLELISDNLQDKRMTELVCGMAFTAGSIANDLNALQSKSKAVRMEETTL